MIMVTTVVLKEVVRIQTGEVEIMDSMMIGTMMIVQQMTTLC
jgi:hypothetical protein